VSAGSAPENIDKQTATNQMRAERHFPPLGPHLERTDYACTTRIPRMGRKASLPNISFLTSAAKIELDVKLHGIFEKHPDLRRQALTIIGPVTREAVEHKLSPLRADLAHQQSSATAGIARPFEGAYVELDMSAELDLTCSARTMAEQCLKEALDETALALERLLEERAN
jgi:hypothetical protein